jgi:hypothetical protein
MNEETMLKLMEMGAMAELYKQQSQYREYNGMDFDDRFNFPWITSMIEGNQIS